MLNEYWGQNGSVGCSSIGSADVEAGFLAGVNLHKNPGDSPVFLSPRDGILLNASWSAFNQ